MIKVSVVVPAYNEEKVIEKCLEALVKQDFPKANYEIIVVDNASTDRTAEIARKASAKVVLEKRKGIAYARQAGLEACKGDIVCCTDADTIVPEDWISRIYTRYQSDPKLVSLGGGFRFWDKKGILVNSYCLVVRIVGLAVNSLGLPHLIGYNHSYRRKEFTRLGGYDPRFQIHEDTVASQRLAKAGKHIFDPSIIVYTSYRRFNKIPLLAHMFITVPSGFLAAFNGRKPIIPYRCYR